MDTLLGEKMKEAIDKKQSDITRFIWKGRKERGADGKYKQTEKRLVDMSQRELEECYDRCKTMLFNTDPENPGRYLVLKEISDQKDRCGAELFIRHVDQNNHFSRFFLLGTVNDFIKNNKEALKGHKPVAEDAFNGIPSEFLKVPLNLVIDGCLDRLGTINKKHITRTFILRLGIWLTSTESKDLVEVDEDGKVRDRLEVIRERLNIKDAERLHVNSRGLNYTQMRAMLNIKANKKYLDLTTSQLETLRNRVLFNLEDAVKGHIADWERRMEEIELVLTSKGYKING